MGKFSFYELLHKIDDDSNLARCFNEALRKLGIVRMITSPSTFERMSEDADQHCIDLFYESCLWEMYLHGVISKLHGWQAAIDKYLKEFEGSWKYYASYKRIESIKEYGGEDGDYDDNGNIRIVNLSDKDLEHYTIIGDLIQNDWRDIVQETKPEHLDGLLAALQTQGEISITDIVAKITGQEIPVYREDEKGKMVEMSFADKALLRISNKSSAEELAIIILFACTSIRSIIEELKSLDKFKDNNGRLMSIYRDIGCLLSMDFKEMRVVNSFSQKK